MINKKILEYVSSKINNNSSKSEITELVSEMECREWIYNVSKISSQRYFTSHVPKFVHPDAKISSFIIFPKKEDDGYIRTGNCSNIIDSYGNAGAMAVSDFFSLIIDGKMLYEHLINQSDVYLDMISFLGDYGAEADENFKKLIVSNSISYTDSRLRQIYFPTFDNQKYHILTPLMSTSVMYEFNRIIDENRLYNNNPLNIEGKNPKRVFEFEKNKEFLENGYKQISDLVDINYGGSEPQNISTYNKKIKTFKLIKALPPKLVKRNIRIPKNSFFRESVYIKSDRYKSLFEQLHHIFINERNNLDIRNKRDCCLLSIMQEIAVDIVAIRKEIKLANLEYRGNLNSVEYLLLYQDEERFEGDDWLLSFSTDFARWLLDSYSKLIDNYVPLGDEELKFIRDFAFENREVFIQ